MSESVDFETHFALRYADFGLGLEIDLVSSNIGFKCLPAHGFSVYFHKCYANNYYGLKL